MQTQANISKIARILSISVVLFLWGTPYTQACEACNRLFRASLVSDERAGSLVARELLATIAAQENLIYPAGSEDYESLNINKTMFAAISPATMSRIPGEPEESPAETKSVGNSLPPNYSNDEFINIMARDNRLPIPSTSYVPQYPPPDVKMRVTLQENESYIGNGVIYKGFTI